jgi:hypothetical protein
MIKPIYLGLFRDSLEALYHARNHSPTGLFSADFHEYEDSLKSNNIYFWTNDSIPYFAIFIFSDKNLRMVALNAAYLNSNIPYERGQLLYTSLDEFCNRTIEVNHPATEWLLFNQDLWNDSNSLPKHRV